MTAYSTIYDWFFHMIEEDRDFFRYYELSDKEVMELAQQRAKPYMEEAVSRIVMSCFPVVDFMARTNEDDGFTQTLTQTEIFLIASLMFEQYMERDIAYLKRLSVNYTSKEMTVFSPDNWRNSFQSMLESIREKNLALMDEYRNKDRETGQFRAIMDFAKYDES